MEFDTLLYTSTERADLFEWQERVFEAHFGKQCVRVDAWEIQQHPCPGGTFTLYACTIVLVTVMKEEGDARRTAAHSPAAQEEG